MAFQREKQRISSSEILQALADGDDIRLEGCTISGDLDVNRLFVKDESFDTSHLEVGSRDETSVVTFSQSIVFNSCTFEGNVCFAGPWDKPGELTVIFKRDIGFNSSCFQGQTRFDGVVFRGLAGFDGCTFQRVVGFMTVYLTATTISPGNRNKPSLSLHCIEYPASLSDCST